MENYYYTLLPESVALLKKQLHTHINYVYSNGAFLYAHKPVIEFELYLAFNNFLIYSNFNPNQDCSADICKLSFEESHQVVQTHDYSIIDKKIGTNYVKYHTACFEISQIDIYKISYQDEYEHIDWENTLLFHSKDKKRILIYPANPFTYVCFVYNSPAIDEIIEQRGLVFSRGV
jgi:hypothetical protein